MVTTNQIEACECFKTFSGLEKMMAIKKANRDLLHTNIIQYNLTGKFLPTNSRNNLKILNELVK